MSDCHLTPADLSSDQTEVFESMMDWSTGFGRDTQPILSVGGLAGTGKTTLLGVFAATTKRRVAYAAFTGRAASILTRKLRAAGARHVEATTIHRLMYAPIMNDKEEVKGWRRRKELSDAYDLIAIDEASMVSGSMLNDLKTYGLPILAVGDHGQLPPVMDSGDLMKNPMLRLEKIHRQAEGNPIILLAHYLRDMGRLDRRFVAAASGYPNDGEVIRFLKKTETLRVLQEEAQDRMAPPLDVGLLCWRNDTRVKLNGTARKAFGFSGPPKADEILICLRNEAPVFNGMRGVLRKDAFPSGDLRPWEIIGDIEFPDEGLARSTFTMLAPQFNRPETFREVAELQARGVTVDRLKEAGSLFDFGYALTVHKSQGSSFRHAVVFLDRPVKPESEDWRRWAYTAVTRASERLTVLT